MSSNNALGWVFPGAGEDTPSTRSEVDFGPVHWKDTIILEFTPKSYTGEIRLYCQWQDTMQGNIWTLENTGSPLTYKFTDKTPNPDDPTDYHACHFFFAANTASTSSGNTLSFQYLNNASTKAVTWSSSGNSTDPISTTTSSTSSTTTTTTTTSPTSTPPTTTTTSSTRPGQEAATGNPASPDFTAVSQSSGLSTGAIAGIVVGVVILIGLIAGLGFFFGRRARRNRTDGPSAIPPRDETKIQPMYQSDSPSYPQQGYYGQQQTQHVPAWSNKQQPVRMGELQGQAVSELYTPAVHEMDGGRRNELPG